MRILVVLIVLLGGEAWAGPEQIVDRLLRAWQVPAAARAVEPLLEAMPDLPAIQAAAGRVKFHQQRYADALDLMRRAKAATGKDPRDFTLIRETYEVTKGFVEHRGKRLVVRMEPGPDEVLVPYLIDGLDRAIERLAPRFGVEIDAPLTVEVYPTAKAFSRVSTLSMKAIETSGTIALCKFDRLMLISPRATLRGYDWLDTAAHELIHLLISRRSWNTVPVWLHEGLAKYHQSGWNGPFGAPLRPYSAELLARAINRKTLITFEEMSPSMAYLPSQEATATAFAEVHTAIEYLLETHGEGAILKLMDGLRESSSQLDPAFKAVTGGDLAQFESDWRRWLVKRPFETRHGTVAPAIAFGVNRAAVDDDDPGRPDGEAGRYARLGDLLYRRGHRAAAAVEYQRSVDRAGVGYPGLNHRLAACLIAGDKTDRAKQLLDQSVARNPHDPRSHILLGRLAIRAKRHDEALSAYERANQINPFDPEVHQGMRHAAAELKKDNLVSRETEALERLRPSSERVAPPKNGDKALGALTLRSTPWAEVLIDDEMIGRSTPLEDYPLPAGRHEVVLRAPALSLERRLDVTIVAGQTTTLELRLEERE